MPDREKYITSNIDPRFYGLRVRDIDDFSPQGFGKKELEIVYYKLTASRHDDARMLEAAPFAEVDNYYNPGTEIEDDGMVMEAITVQRFSRIDRRMAAVVRTFNKHLEGEVIAEEAVIGKPRKSGSFAYVTVQVPFSDAQTVSIVFHSPDGNAKKIGPEDSLIAFRWLLNKRDITHVVAPEGGQEVSLETIGKRIAQLVEKNHARFVATQKDAVEEKKRLDAVKSEIDRLESENQELALQASDSLGKSSGLESKVEKTRTKVEAQKTRNADLEAEIAALKARIAAKSVGGDGSNEDPTPGAEGNEKAIPPIPPEFSLDTFATLVVSARKKAAARVKEAEKIGLSEERFNAAREAMNGKGYYLSRNAVTQNGHAKFEEWRDRLKTGGEYSDPLDAIKDLLKKQTDRLAAIPDSEAMKKVSTAMDKMKEPGFAGWGEEEFSKTIREGEERGWLTRRSITQIDWTEKGVEDFKSADADSVAQTNELPEIKKGYYIKRKQSGLGDRGISWEYVSNVVNDGIMVEDKMFVVPFSDIIKVRTGNPVLNRGEVIYDAESQATDGEAADTPDLPAGWKSSLNENGEAEYVDEKGNSVTIALPTSDGGSYSIQSWKGEVLQDAASTTTLVEANKLATSYMTSLSTAQAQQDKDDADIDKKANGLSAETKAHIEILKPFMPAIQMKTIADALKGEESEFFVEKLAEYAERVQTMPKTYEQDGKGDEAVAYLHFFTGGSDWYITEKDMGEEQIQAFGYTILNGDKQNAELGYISIDEITSLGAELDLHWEPKSLGKIKGKGEPEPEAADEESGRIVQGKQNVQAVVDEIGGALSAWEPREGSSGRWEYSNLTVGDQTIRIGVSGGGVVSVDGHPFDPDGSMNVNIDAVRKSLLDKVQAGTEPEQVETPPAVEILNAIVRGDYDHNLSDLEAALEQALDELEGAGLDEQYADLLEQASDHYTNLLSDKAKEA